MILQGWALADHVQIEQGLAEMRQGLAAWRCTGAELVQPYWLALLTELHRKPGQSTDGLTALAKALALVDKNAQRYYEAELYRLKGELLPQAVGPMSGTTMPPSDCHRRLRGTPRHLGGNHTKNWDIMPC
jgi:predicted ATPase